MTASVTERTANDICYLYVAKSNNVYSKPSEITFIKTRCDDASAIFNNTYNVVEDNQFTTVLPYVEENPPKRSTEYLSFDGCIQPVILEFDKCSMELQQERAEFLADELNTPMFLVHSGNKSYHHYIYFKNFADNNDEYKLRCKQFVAYLAKEYPEYYVTEQDANKNVELVPDYSMFTGNRYTRQADGKRDNGVKQEAWILHDVDDCDALSIDIFLSDNNSYSGAETGDSGLGLPIEKKKPRRSTYEFLAIGASEGERDNRCYQAACNLRECGYSMEDATMMLIEGGKRCTPVFPESEVKNKVKSAWSNTRNGGYNPIDKSRPFPFIERSTSDYFYVLEDRLYQAKKSVLKDILKSHHVEMPDPLPVFEFKFDVNDDTQIDFSNRTFNLFTPTMYHLMNPDGQQLDGNRDFPTINKLLTNLIPVDSERNHFLNWLACALRTRKKLMTAYVLKGAQGAGKGLLFGRVFKPMFGETQTMQIEDEQLKQPFNGYLKNVCFIAFNEVAHDNNGRNSLNSKIKSMITDPTITINEKFVRPFVINNNANCIFFSNESVPLLIEQSDRRFNVVETGDALTKNNWFNAEKTIPMLTAELKNFAQYLWNLDINIGLANTALANDVKNSLISASTNRFQEFAMKLKEADIEWFIDNYEGYSTIDEWTLDQLKDKKISKNKALDLFKGIYPDQRITQTNLTKKLRLFNILDGRDKTFNRERIYFWST